jgi:hypothetical protein
MSDKTSWTPGTEDLAVVDALAKHQAAMELSDGVFAREHLSYSEKTWLRIRKGEYWAMVQDGRKVIDDLSQDLGRLERLLAFRGRFAAVSYVRTTETAAVMAAVDACLRKPVRNPDRAVVFLAPTGGGKSALCGELVRQAGARMVEARKSWLRSYFAATRDMAIACEVSIKKCLMPDDMEEALLRRLNSFRQVIAIDEGEYFSPTTLSLLKLMLNKSPVVIVLCATPDAYESWNRKGGDEAWQFRRRTHAVIQCEPITPKLAAQFFRHVHLAPTDGACAAEAARFANTFGHYDTLTRLGLEFEEGETVTREDMFKRGNAIRTKLRLEPLRW